MILPFPSSPTLSYENVFPFFSLLRCITEYIHWIGGHINFPHDQTHCVAPYFLASCCLLVTPTILPSSFRSGRGMRGCPLLSILAPCRISFPPQLSPYCTTLVAMFHIIFLHNQNVVPPPIRLKDLTQFVPSAPLPDLSSPTYYQYVVTSFRTP